MSKLSALDHVYTAGINAERTRVRGALYNHLSNTYRWSKGEVDELMDKVFTKVMLDKPVVKELCAVCNLEYRDTEKAKSVYGQPIHEECVGDMATLIQQLFHKEK